MKKIVRTILLAGLMITMLGGVNVYANELEIDNMKGNGNDGCQIGNIPGHKNHGQSNEHKIDYMTKVEWEGYLIANNLIGQQMSNNEGSNGWITYHIYNSEGKQIEVVHIKFKAEEVPSVDEKPEEDIPMIPIEPSKPVKPEEGDKLEEGNKPGEEEEGNKEEDKEEEGEDKVEIPMTPLEPSNPVVPENKPEDKPEDSEPMLPLEPSIPVKPEENPDENPDDEQPMLPIEEPKLPVEEEDSISTKPTENDIKLESDKTTENNLNDNNNIVNTNTEISDYNNNHYTDNPKTGDAGLGLSILGVIGSIGVIGIINKKRK